MKTAVMFVSLLAPAMYAQTAPQVPAPAQLTDIEQTKLENFQLKRSILERQYADLLGAAQAFTAEVLQAHHAKGELDPQTFQIHLTQPAAPAAPAKK